MSNKHHLLKIENFAKTLFNLRDNPIKKNEFIRNTLEVPENNFLIENKYKELIESRVKYYNSQKNCSLFSLNVGKLSDLIKSKIKVILLFLLLSNISLIIIEILS